MTKQRDLNGEWEAIGGETLLRWDAPRTVVGVYQGNATVSGKYGVQKKHTMLLDGADGPQRVEFFAPAVLERLLASPKVQPGKRLKIEFTGEELLTKSGRTAKEFVVEIARM